MVVTQETLEEYLAMARRRYGVYVVEKTTSKLMRLIAALLFFNRDFLAGYITTIGTTVYWPNRDQMYMHPDQAFGVMFHEVQHAADYRWCPPIFVLGYLAPQALAIFALLAVLAAVLSPWWLLWLLALLLLAPLPSLGRTIIEMRACATAMALRRWQTGDTDLSDAAVDALVARFTGPDYFWMMPSRRVVEWLARRYQRRVNETRCSMTEVQRATRDFRRNRGMRV